MPTIPDRDIAGEGSHLLGGGPIASLEAHLREFVGMGHAVCVANGTLGLMAAAMATNLSGREVIVPALAHPASVAGLLHLGARLRVADVDVDTLALDVCAARREVTSKTAAVLAVDLFGIPSDTVALRSFADDHGLFYLADAAQALGATRADVHASSCADAVVLSFTTGKLLDAGEGGALLTNQRELYERVVWQTQHTYRQRRDVGLHLDNPFAINMRMHPTTAHLAATLLPGLADRLAAHRAAVLEVCRVIETSQPGTCLPAKNPAVQPSYFRLPVRLSSTPARVLSTLQAHGFTAYVDPEPPIPFYEHAAFRSLYRNQLEVPHACPVAEQARRQIVTLQIQSHANTTMRASRFPGVSFMKTSPLEPRSRQPQPLQETHS